MAVVYGNLSSEKSEQKVLKHLEKNLNEEWIIYQNFLLDKNVDDGQVDFLILHKTIGGIILEVKGGRIETYLDPNNEYKWLSINRKNEKFSIKDPFLQSKDQAWKLKRYLKDIKTMMHSFNFVNAAAFPDVQKIDFESPFMNDLNTFSREDLIIILDFSLKNCYKTFSKGLTLSKLSNNCIITCYPFLKLTQPYKVHLILWMNSSMKQPKSSLRP